MKARQLLRGWRKCWDARTVGGQIRSADGCGSRREDTQLDDAFRTLEQVAHISKDKLYHILKECAANQNLSLGRRVHALSERSGYGLDMFLSNHIIRMYASNGSLREAERVFRELPAPDVYVWTSMISAYTDNGQSEDAIELYKSMRQSTVRPDDYVFVGILRACAIAADLMTGKLVHTDVRENGFESNVYVGSALVDMYAKCGSLDDALGVFHRLHTKNVVTWNAMIGGYALHGLGRKSLEMFAEMECNSKTAPNAVTFTNLVRACCSTGDLKTGKRLHYQILERGLDRDTFLGNTLVDMFVKCGSLEDARKVFSMLPTRDVVTWGAIIGGYAQHGLGQEALQLFWRMQDDGITASDVIFVSVLKACGSIGAIQEGRRIHVQILDRGLEVDLFVGNALIDMYAKCGSVEDARTVFDRLRFRDVVTWNAMIAGYVQNEQCKEALNMFATLQRDDMVPDSVTFISVLKACGSIGALQDGNRIHAEVKRRGLDTDVSVGSALVDMYAKCGRIEDAQRVFDGPVGKNVVTWTALIKGYGQSNNHNMAIQCFDNMLQQGVEPNAVTFTCLLVACSHVGLVNEGKRYFKSMIEDHGIMPTVEHYNCMVDLLARSGYLEEAHTMLQTMPLEQDAVGWKSLLSACKTHGNIDIGRHCFDRLMEMEPQEAAGYVLMSDIYANAGRREDVKHTDKLRKLAANQKKPAMASISVNNKVHEFIVGDKRVDTSAKLRSLNEQMSGDQASEALPVREEDTLCGHAEKLALAYGLLNTPDGTTLLVTKNLRMCDQCHSGTKIISKMERREIVVRDAHRVHRFADGLCSCGGSH